MYILIRKREMFGRYVNVAVTILSCGLVMSMLLTMRIQNYQHDVFLGFRGADLRSNFLSHLQHILTDSNINVFIDERLDRGETLTKGIVQGIQQSRVSVLIFSSDFASSTYCLDEVVVTMKSQGFRRMVVPVFYGIEPSDVEFQNGTFESSFVRHEDTYRCRRSKVERWRKSLKDASNLAGFVSKAFSSDVELAKEIVKDVRSKLEWRPTKFGDKLNLMYKLMVNYYGQVMKYVEGIVSGYHRFLEEAAEY